MTKHVYNLKDACEAYWCATSFREMQAAYHEILLFGGKDGFPNRPGWRVYMARQLRKLALFVEGNKNEKAHAARTTRNRKVNAVLQCLEAQHGFTASNHPARMN